jgi:hypothetical protein
MDSNKECASLGVPSTVAYSGETAVIPAPARVYQSPRLSVIGKAVDLVQGPATGKYSDGPGHGYIER